MNTFYGGPRGQNFILSETFDNTRALKEDLKLGNNSPILNGGIVMITYGGTPESNIYQTNLTIDNNNGYNNCNASIFEKIIIGSPSDLQELQQQTQIITSGVDTGFPHYGYKFLTSSLGITKEPLSFKENFNIDIQTPKKTTLFTDDEINWWSSVGLEDVDEEKNPLIQDEDYLEVLECILKEKYPNVDSTPDVLIPDILNNKIAENETIVGNYVLYKNKDSSETLHLTVFYMRTKTKYVKGASSNLSPYFVISKISGFYQPPKTLSEIEGFAYDANNNKIFIGKMTENLGQLADFPINSITIGDNLISSEEEGTILLGQYNTNITPAGIGANAKLKLAIGDGTNKDSRHNAFAIYEDGEEYKIVLNNNVIHDSSKNFDLLNQKIEAIRNLPLIDSYLNEQYQKKAIPASKRDYVFCQDETWRKLNHTENHTLLIYEPEVNFHFILPSLKAEGYELKKVELKYASTEALQSDYYYIVDPLLDKGKIYDSTKVYSEGSNFYSIEDETEGYLIDFAPWAGTTAIDMGLYDNKKYQLIASYETAQQQYGVITGLNISTEGNQTVVYGQEDYRQFTRHLNITIDNILPLEGYHEEKGEEYHTYMPGFTMKFQNFTNSFIAETQDQYSKELSSDRANPLNAKEIQTKTEYKRGDYVYSSKLGGKTDKNFYLYQCIKNITPSVSNYGSAVTKDDTGNWVGIDKWNDHEWIRVDSEIETIVNDETKVYGAGYPYCSLLWHKNLDFWYMANKISQTQYLKYFYTGEKVEIELKDDNQLILPQSFVLSPRIGDYYTPDEGKTKYYLAAVNEDEYYNGAEPISEFTESGQHTTLTNYEEISKATATFTFAIPQEYTISIQEDAWHWRNDQAAFEFNSICEFVQPTDTHGGMNYYTNNLFIDPNDALLYKNEQLILPKNLYQCVKDYKYDSNNKIPPWRAGQPAENQKNWETKSIISETFFDAQGAPGHIQHCGYHDLDINASALGYVTFNSPPKTKPGSSYYKQAFKPGFDISVENKYAKMAIIPTVLSADRTGKSQDTIVYSLHKSFLPSEKNFIGEEKYSAQGNNENINTQTSTYNEFFDLPEILNNTDQYWTRSPGKVSGWVLVKKDENNLLKSGVVSFPKNSRDRAKATETGDIALACTVNVVLPSAVRKDYYHYSDGYYTEMYKSRFYITTTIKGIAWSMFCI